MKSKRRLVMLLCAGALLMAACMTSGGGGSSTAIPVVTETVIISTLPASCADALQSPEPVDKSGLIVYGCVSGADGVGLAGVKILRAYASYPGEQVAVSGPDGRYQSEFMPIPGDEMVRVWAELEGIDFDPGSKMVWQDGAYYWRHYAGYEATRLDFTAR